MKIFVLLIATFFALLFINSYIYAQKDISQSESGGYYLCTGPGGSNCKLVQPFILKPNPWYSECISPSTGCIANFGPWNRQYCESFCSEATFVPTQFTMKLFVMMPNGASFQVKECTSSFSDFSCSQTYNDRSQYGTYNGLAQTYAIGKRARWGSSSPAVDEDVTTPILLSQSGWAALYTVSPPPSVCGNNNVEAGEQCDPPGINQSCLTSDNKLGTRTCQNNCQLSSCVYVGPCTRDADCPLDKVCVDGSCIDKCKKDDDCPLDKVCSDGRCVNKCTKDADCPYGNICSDGKCIPKPVCKKDSDCKADEVCSNNRCVSKEDKPQLTDFKFGGDVNYFNAFWKASYPSGRQNQITVECTFNCDPRTANCENAQKCQPYPFTQSPGSGGCSVVSPKYVFDNKIFCKAYDTSNPTLFNWY